MTESTTESSAVDGEPPAAACGSRKYESWGITEAAAFLRIHPATLAERARGGEIPGCKVGRSWVFMPELLAEYLRTKSTEKVQRFRNVPSASVSLAERLAAKRAQREAGRETAARQRIRRGGDETGARRSNGQFRPGFGRPTRS